ncbi:membrane protein [Streptomyces noursei ATCC 11455]|uniref:hypothetical protein n=1 Tax=Streptomyces noursei TaxID=1971 RepID=UPI00081C621C|nr:membrane protein [Streptomyces noursei ATCC 11455]
MLHTVKRAFPLLSIFAVFASIAASPASAGGVREETLVGYAYSDPEVGWSDEATSEELFPGECKPFETVGSGESHAARSGESILGNYTITFFSDESCTTEVGKAVLGKPGKNFESDAIRYTAKSDA